VTRSCSWASLTWRAAADLCSWALLSLNQSKNSTHNKSVIIVVIHISISSRVPVRVYKFVYRRAYAGVAVQTFWYTNRIQTRLSFAFRARAIPRVYKANYFCSSNSLVCPALLACSLLQWVLCFFYTIDSHKLTHITSNNETLYVTLENDFSTWKKLVCCLPLHEMFYYYTWCVSNTVFNIEQQRRKSRENHGGNRTLWRMRSAVKRECDP